MKLLYYYFLNDVIKNIDPKYQKIINPALDKTYLYANFQEILSYYRRTNSTLQSNKFKAISRIWYLYRKQEKLNLFYSIYNFSFYAFNAVKRRIQC